MDHNYKRRGSSWWFQSGSFRFSGDSLLEIVVIVFVVPDEDGRDQVLASTALPFHALPGVA